MACGTYGRPEKRREVFVHTVLLHVPPVGTQCFLGLVLKRVPPVGSPIDGSAFKIVVSRDAPPRMFEGQRRGRDGLTSTGGRTYLQ